MVAQRRLSSLPAGVYKPSPARYYKDMSNHIDPAEGAYESFEAFEAYAESIWGLLVQACGEDAVWAVNDAVNEMIASYFGDGSDPLHPERASNRIIDGLGL